MEGAGEAGFVAQAFGTKVIREEDGRSHMLRLVKQHTFGAKNMHGSKVSL